VPAPRLPRPAEPARSRIARSLGPISRIGRFPAQPAEREQLIEASLVSAAGFVHQDFRAGYQLRALAKAIGQDTGDLRPLR
jgi:hypothetical protein